MAEQLNDTQFYGESLLPMLHARGFEAYVEHTGGHCATFMVTKTGSNDRILIGPGSFNWDEPGKSVFTTDELAIGADLYYVDDTERDADPDEVRAKRFDTMDAIAQITEDVWNSIQK